MTRNEFKKLPLSKKINYITWQTIAACFTLALIFCYVQKEFKINQPSLKVEMIDARQDISDDSAFSPFFRENGFSQDPAPYQVHKRIQLGNEEERPLCNPYQLLFCSVNAYDTDLYFWDSADVERTLSKKSLMDLRDFLPAETLRRYDDQLIYSGSLLKGGYPCGISLKGTLWLEKNNYYDDCAAGIVRTANNPETASQFLNFILQ